MEVCADALGWSSVNPGLCLHTGAGVELVVKFGAGRLARETNMDNVILLGFLFVIVGVVVYLVMIYNGLVVLKNDIDKAWANIDVMLKQRHDELPKLIEVCKGYMNFERDTFQKITEARSLYQRAVTIDQKAKAD